MRWKKSPASVVLELSAVLLVTSLAFAWGVRVAQAERGFNTIGGECLSILIPPMYYTVKRMAMDWAADVKRWTSGTRR